MPKGVWIRDGSRAIPADERSMEFLLSKREGEPFIADTHGARNPKQLALWFVLCRLVAMQYEVPDETIHHDIKIALGYADPQKQRDGTVKMVAKSISYESMSQEHFNNLFKAAVDKIAEWLGSSPREVMDQFNAMVGDKRYGGVRR